MHLVQMSESRFDTEMQWSLTDISKGARTIEENVELSKLLKNCENIGHIDQPTAHLLEKV